MLKNCIWYHTCRVQNCAIVKAFFAVSKRESRYPYPSTLNSPRQDMSILRSQMQQKQRLKLKNTAFPAHSKMQTSQCIQFFLVIFPFGMCMKYTFSILSLTFSSSATSFLWSACKNRATKREGNTNFQTAQTRKTYAGRKQDLDLDLDVLKFNCFFPGDRINDDDHARALFQNAVQANPHIWR